MNTLGLKIVTFFLLSGVGFLARRRRMLGAEGVRDLIRLNMDVCLPALTFTVAASRLTPEVAAVHRGFAGPLLGLPLAAVLTVLAGMALGRLTTGLAGVHGNRARTYVYLLTFANAAFLPYPLSYAMHGEDGVLFVALYTVGYTPLFWTLGTWMVSGRIEKKFFLHPNLFALAGGAVLGMTGTAGAVPGLLMDILKLLGASAIPMALVYAGAVLAEHSLSLKGDVRPLAVLAGLKLVVMPLAALLIVRYAGVPEPIGSQAVLQTAMPCMAQAGLYAARFGGDSPLASKASFFTTILCIVTVPAFLNRLG